MAEEFFYGAATSAHQVEGNNVYNDWWEWEQGRPKNMRSGGAVEHFWRFKSDFGLAVQLGHNAHRLSLEWSRIEPEKGRYDRGAISHYREVLTELRKLRLKSFVTLHHFTNPMWFFRMGGWENKRAASYFEKYVKTMAEQLGDLADFWLTINEPMVYAAQAYAHHRWPPQKASKFATWRVIRHLAVAHRRAYRVIHRLKPEARVGAAMHLIAYIPPKTKWLGDKAIAALQNSWFNHYFYRLTRGTHDFLGVNYYFASEKRTRLWPVEIKEKKWQGPVSDLNWPIRPEGLTHVLRQLQKYKLPIYVTENGLADAADSKRADFIRSHLRAIEAAQKDGVDVRGYLHWSLLDNFEWDLGFGPRFGLVEVDYETQARRIRPSALVYKGIIEQARSHV